MTASETEALIFNISISELYMWETLHGHSSDSTNAVIQFIQMENVLKILLNGQSVGGHLPLRPPTKMLGGTYPPYNRRPLCFNTVGWAAGRASGLQKTKWWGAGVVVCLEQT